MSAFRHIARLLAVVDDFQRKPTLRCAAMATVLSLVSAYPARAQNEDDLIKGIFGLMLNGVIQSAQDEAAQKQYAENLKSAFFNYDELNRKGIQKSLSALGYYQGSVDGLWGQGTLAAVLKIVDEVEYEELLANQLDIRYLYDLLVADAASEGERSNYRGVSSGYANDWSQLSLHERICWNRALAANDFTLRKLQKSGIPLSDSRVSGISAGCSDWAQGVLTNFSCTLNYEGGGTVETRCNEYFVSGSSSQKIDERAALEQLLNGAGFQRLTEETKQAEVDRKAAEARQAAEEKAAEERRIVEQRNANEARKAAKKYVKNSLADGRKDISLRAVFVCTGEYGSGVERELASSLGQQFFSESYVYMLTTTPFTKYCSSVDYEVSVEKFKAILGSNEVDYFDTREISGGYLQDIFVVHNFGNSEMSLGILMWYKEGSSTDSTVGVIDEPLLKEMGGIEGKWCQSMAGGATLKWECGELYGCLPLAPSGESHEPAAEISWSESGVSLSYRALTKNKYAEIVRECKIDKENNVLMNLSCDVKRDSLAGVKNYTMSAKLTKCD